MAEEYGVKLKVTADTAEAQQQMDELLQRKSQRVRDAVSPSNGEGATGGTGINAKRLGRNLGQSFNDEVSKGPSGKMIGKAIAGFILHQGIGTAFSFARTAGGDNTNVDRAQGAVGGAVQYGTAGAMIGGPWGALIGGALGGIMGLVGQLGKERQDRQNTRLGMWNSAWSSNESTMSGLGSVAQQRLLDWQGSRENRVEWLTQNRKDLWTREQEARKRLSDFNGDTSSKEYAYLQGDYQRTLSQYNQAISAEMQERIKPAYEMYDASEFSDAFSKRGLSVGASVDVGTANERIIDQQAKMVELLQEIVKASHDGAGMYGANLNEILNRIVQETALR